MVSISVESDTSNLEEFLSQHRLAHIPSSLGSVESLPNLLRMTSLRHHSPVGRDSREVDEGLVRLSLAREEPDYLVRDITEVLEALHRVAPPALYFDSIGPPGRATVAQSGRAADS